MNRMPNSINARLDKRQKDKALRYLTAANDLIDFSSNDYLGFARNEQIFEKAKDILSQYDIPSNGATGSRLLSGNHQLYQELEHYLCKKHQAETALVFNSGYDANLGLLSSIPQRGDLIFYDEYSHASIRDGIQLSNAKAYKFQHNDLENLIKKLEQFSDQSGEKYIITESVFSMDGDRPDLIALSKIAAHYHAFLIVDEAHATGVIGAKGLGLVQELGLEKQVFARMHTFGKAMGSHGAVVLGSKMLKDFLINFARSFIYTTGLSPHTLATVLSAYQELENSPALAQLQTNIAFFKKQVKAKQLEAIFIKSDTAIQSCIIPGNVPVKAIAHGLAKSHFEVKPILSPTVPAGKERLRFCLHSFNQHKAIQEVIHELALLRKNILQPSHS